MVADIYMDKAWAEWRSIDDPTTEDVDEDRFCAQGRAPPTFTRNTPPTPWSPYESVTENQKIKHCFWQMDCGWDFHFQFVKSDTGDLASGYGFHGIQARLRGLTPKENVEVPQSTETRYVELPVEALSGGECATLPNGKTPPPPCTDGSGILTFEYEPWVLREAFNIDPNRYESAHIEFQLTPMGGPNYNGVPATPSWQGYTKEILTEEQTAAGVMCLPTGCERCKSEMDQLFPDPLDDIFVDACKQHVCGATEPNSPSRLSPSNIRNLLPSAFR